MKRKNFGLATFLLAAVTSFGFVACDGSSASGSDSSVSVEGSSLVASVEAATETMVVVKVTEAEETTTFIDVLQALKEDGKLTYESTSGQYGAYITSVNGKEETTTNNLTGSEGYSWMVYTSDASVANTEDKIPDTEYYSAMNGVSMLEVKAGHSYVLYYKYWSYNWA